jgi:hypothetical protein
MTINIDDNVVDVIVWLMWTVFIALLFYFIGNYVGFQHGVDVGYMAAYTDYLESF